MEEDVLKSAWHGIATVRKESTELKSMISDRAHPVLSAIRKQLIVESVAFVAFLFVYYDFFDGDRKPLYANTLLVVAMLLTIGHNILGYLLTSRGFEGINIKHSLQIHLRKIKSYAILSVLIRALVAGCLLVFFTSVISFNSNKVWILIAALIIFIIQIAFLSRVWIERIRHLKESTNNFKE